MVRMKRQRIPKVLPLSKHSQFAELYTLGGFPELCRWQGMMDLNHHELFWRQCDCRYLNPLWNDRGNPEGELFRQIALFVELADMYSVPTPYRWSGILDLNQRPYAYQAYALNLLS